MRGLPAQTNFANPTPTTRRSARSDTPERRAYPAQCSMVYCSGMDQPTKDAFAKLTTTVERQSDALASLSETVGALSKTVERGFSALAEDIAAVRREMATKGELAELRTEMREGFASIRAELPASRNARRGRAQFRGPHERDRSPHGARARDRKTSRHRDQNRRLTNTIDYVVADQNGLASTRTVLIEPNHGTAGALSGDNSPLIRRN